jgi:hypothetical protein
VVRTSTRSKSRTSDGTLRWPAGTNRSPALTLLAYVRPAPPAVAVVGGGGGGDVVGWGGWEERSTAVRRNAAGSIDLQQGFGIISC